MESFFFRSSSFCCMGSKFDGPKHGIAYTQSWFFLCCNMGLGGADGCTGFVGFIVLR